MGLFGSSFRLLFVSAPALALLQAMPAHSRVNLRVEPFDIKPMKLEEPAKPIKLKDGDHLVVAVDYYTHHRFEDYGHAMAEPRSEAGEPAPGSFPLFAVRFVSPDLEKGVFTVSFEKNKISTMKAKALAGFRFFLNEKPCTSSLTLHDDLAKLPRTEPIQIQCPEN